MRLRKKNNFFIGIVIMINAALIINYVGKNLLPISLNIIEKETNKDVYGYVFNTFSKDVMVNEDIIDIISINKNNKDEIISIDYRFDKAYKYLSDSLNKLYLNIDDLNISSSNFQYKNGVFFIPSGIVSKNLILMNFGIKVPYKVKMLNQVNIGFYTKVSNYGINSVLVELYLRVKVINSVFSPYSNGDFENEYNIIIASRLIEGVVPNYYNGVLENSSSIVSS